MSITSDGSQSNGDSFGPSISEDGRYVVFRSDASNLDFQDTNGVTDVFVHDRQTRQTRRISRDDQLSEGVINSYALVSGNGRYIAYQQIDHDTGSSVSYSSYDHRIDRLLVYDQETGLTKQVDLGWNQINRQNYKTIDCSIYNPTMTRDGRYLVYFATESLYRTNVYSLDYSLRVYDLELGIERRMDAKISGPKDFDQIPTISFDGNTVSVILNNSKYSNFKEVHLFDLHTGKRQWLNPVLYPLSTDIHDYFSDFICMSYDGRYAVISTYYSNNGVVYPFDSGKQRGLYDNVNGGILDTVTGRFEPIRVTWTGYYSSGWYPSPFFVDSYRFSPDGSTLVFSSGRNNLTHNDQNNCIDVFTLPNPFFTQPAKGIIAFEDGIGDVRLVSPSGQPTVHAHTNHGVVLLGETTESKELFVYNVGDSELLLQDVLLPDGFILTQVPQPRLAPGKSTAFSIRMLTTSPGIKAGEVRITTNSPVEPVLRFNVQGKVEMPAQLTVYGNGQRIANNDTTPSWDDFTDLGIMATNRGSLTRSFELRNVGEYTLNTSVGITGPAAKDFSVDTVDNMQADGSRRLKLRFNPTADGVRRATVEIHSNDPGHPVYRFNVQGTGVSRRLPKGMIEFDYDYYSDYVTIRQGTGVEATHGSALRMHMVLTKNDGTVVYSSSAMSSSPILYRPWADDIFEEYNLKLWDMKLGEERILFANSYANYYPGYPWWGQPPYANLTPYEKRMVDDDTLIMQCKVFDLLHPEADLRGKGVPIVHGDKTPSLNDGTDFGTLSTREEVTQYFTLHNLGPQGTKLYFDHPEAVRILGSHKNDFVVGEITESDDNIVTIPVTFKPSAAGHRQATLKIANQDLDESDYTIALCGKGTLPTVTVDGIDSTAAETMLAENPNIGIVRLSTGDAPTTRPLTINFTTAGPAVRGSFPKGDYLMMVGGTLLPINAKSVTIPAGMSHVDVHVLPVNDGLVESFENVVFNLAGGTGYQLPKSTAQRQAVIVLVDNDTKTNVKVDNYPNVSVAAIVAEAWEPSYYEKHGIFRISRSGAVDQPLFVDFSVSGSATRGTLSTSDYVLKVGDTILTTNRVEIPANAFFVDVRVVPFRDWINDNEETVVLSLNDMPSYLLSNSNKMATILIRDW